MAGRSGAGLVPVSCRGCPADTLPAGPCGSPSQCCKAIRSSQTPGRLLNDAGLEPTVYGVFPLDTSLRGRVLRLAAAVATKMHIVPKTLAGRGALKRIFFGELTPFEGTGAAAQRDADIPTPVRIPGDRQCDGFRVLYAVGRLTG